MDEGFPLTAAGAIRLDGHRQVALFARIPPVGAMAVVLGVFLLAGCGDDEDCKDPTKSYSCPSGSRPTSATLLLEYSNPASYDSVIIEVYQGNADDGTRIRRFRALGGTVSETYSFGESQWGDFSAKAIYHWHDASGGQIDDVFDGGDLGVNSSTDDCGCTTYSVDDLRLDLHL